MDMPSSGRGTGASSIFSLACLTYDPTQAPPAGLPDLFSHDPVITVEGAHAEKKDNTRTTTVTLNDFFILNEFIC